MNSRFSYAVNSRHLALMPSGGRGERKIHIKSNDVQKCDAYHHSIFIKIDKYLYIDVKKIEKKIAT